MSERAGDTGQDARRGPGKQTARRRAAGRRVAACAGTGLILASSLALGAATPALAQASGGNRGTPGGSRTTVVGGTQLGARGVVVNYPSRSTRRLPAVRASAYVIADAGTGQVLAAKDPHGRYAPASILKILTVDTLMPVLNPDSTVVTSHRAAIVEPSKVGLIQGRSYKVADLFKALLLISANDAAIALAQATGSYDTGVAMMNAEAHHLQAYDTVAKRPNGLDARGQHASAYDEALFARQALSMPQFLQDEALRVTRFPLRKRHSVKLWNQNTMLASYPGDLGGKIGWTTPAKATFIGWARRNGRTLIVTIMHCQPLTEMTYAARLLNWGFAMDGKVSPVGTLVKPLPVRPARSPAPRPAPAPAPTAVRAQASSSMPTVPVAAAAGALLLAALVAGSVTLVIRRGSQGGNPPAP